jgi:hypothetical protein
MKEVNHDLVWDVSIFQTGNGMGDVCLTEDLLPLVGPKNGLFTYLEPPKFPSVSLPCEDIYPLKPMPN